MILLIGLNVGGHYYNTADSQTKASARSNNPPDIANDENGSRMTLY